MFVGIEQSNISGFFLICDLLKIDFAIELIKLFSLDILVNFVGSHWYNLAIESSSVTLNVSLGNENAQSVCSKVSLSNDNILYQVCDHLKSVCSKKSNSKLVNDDPMTEANDLLFSPAKFERYVIK